MTKITSAQTVGEATVRAIFENPGLNNKQVLRVVQGSHPGRGTEKTVAWYRAHCKKSDLSRSLQAVIAEYGGPTMVPSAMVGGGGRPDYATAADRMVELLRAQGYHVASPVQAALEGVTLEDAKRDLEARAPTSGLVKRPAK